MARQPTKEDVETRSGAASKSKTRTPSTSKTSNVTPPKPVSSKRKANVLTDDADDDLGVTTRESSSKKQKKDEPEKRLKLFRKKAPQTFLQKLERATTQRMIVIGRTRSGEGQDLHEDIDVVGSTGNIYTVTIGRLPNCDCPDYQKNRTECKHKIYALAVVLRAPYELQYQTAFLTTELEEIFSGAPPIPNTASDIEEDNDGKRKPIEGECPICYMDFDVDNNELVWCRAACGNNMHKTCFDQWAASQRGQQVRCVYCRTPWQMETGDLAAIKKAGEESGDGYINVADQFGISRARDYSTYHQPWVRRNFGYG